jgi:hypothetical protein
LKFNSFRVAKLTYLSPPIVPQSGMAQKALTFGGYSRFKPFRLAKTETTKKGSISLFYMSIKIRFK